MALAVVPWASVRSRVASPTPSRAPLPGALPRVQLRVLDVARRCGVVAAPLFSCGALRRLCCGVAFRPRASQLPSGGREPALLDVRSRVVWRPRALRLLSVEIELVLLRGPLHVELQRPSLQLGIDVPAPARLGERSRVVWQRLFGRLRRVSLRVSLRGFSWLPDASARLRGASWLPDASGGQWASSWLQDAWSAPSWLWW